VKQYRLLAPGLSLVSKVQIRDREVRLNTMSTAIFPPLTICFFALGCISAALARAASYRMQREVMRHGGADHTGVWDYFSKVKMRYREMHPNSRLPQTWKVLNALTAAAFVLTVISLF
jgi:hypothetical protein